ncbi:glycoside hydrolase family 3 N-terminal domain-containing protein [Melioribacter sp. OK-6-Me]|uniref:glycoside hydrolase family 3 N-terminal domain-containing protein n=1 Tax=unclassified Melioribacter TaxID=2627329 RepID=UPI003EDA263B
MEKSAHTAKPESEVLYDYKNPELSPDERAEDLLKRMTLEEKVAQMLCIWEDKKTILFDQEGNFSLDKLRENLKNGIGQIARLSDTDGGLNPYQMVEYANAIQKFLVEETRLGIPVIFHEECLHGLAAKDATSYPVPIGLAATFNVELIEKIFSAIAEDARTRGAHQALTPVVDVVRDPRWGRVEETFGEDTYLVSQMGIASVKGLQGDGSLKNNNKVIATLKHFAAHGQPESGTNCAPANFSERFLRDTFLMPFKEAINKAGVISVMASYNEIDGIPSHANKWLLRKVLRDEWGFKGFVVSDYYAITELFHREETVSHGVAANKVEAAKLAVEAGVNIEFPNPDCYPNLTEMVNKGLVYESDIDALVLPMLKYKFKLGLFDNPYIEVEPGQFEKKLEADRELALQAARETITLLKNEGNLLPLRNFKKIAVIGPNADRMLLGGYHGTPKYYTSVYQGIKEKVGNKGEVFYSEGCKITVGGSWNEDEVLLPDPAENEQLINQAVAVAQKSDVAVLVLGGNEQTSREAWNKNHLGDRPSLELVGSQNKLVEEILKTGKPVVVLLFNGRPNSIGFIKDNVPAILECWYLGQETGNAVADVLFGEYNPSGKLPVSIPRSAGHIPAHYSHKPSARRGYLFDDVSPLFAFGYGLSYTKFSFANLKLSKDVISADEKVNVSVDVKNEGQLPGEEVVQLYIRDKVSSVTRPVKELKGFKKIKLDPGHTTTVIFELLPENLAFTNVDMKFVVEPGEFEIMVGNSSRNEDLIKTILTVK